jgi:hypothetical protein
LSSHHHKRGSGKGSHTHKPTSRLPSDLLAYSYKQLKAGKPVAAAGHAEHDKGPFQSVREVEYKGHKITIYTQYEIRVDGEPFTSHIYVDNTGKVSTHALPAYSFVSAVDLVKKIIDEFPDDFTTTKKKSSSRSSSSVSKSRRRR